MTTRAVTAAAALLAVVAVSACAPPVDGQAVAGEQLHPVGELKSGTESVAAPLAGPVWVDVSGQGTILPRDSVDGAQFSATPVPGAVIFHAPEDGDVFDLCTAGPPATGPAGPAVLTAGHCALGARSAAQYVLPADDSAAVLLGTASGAVDDDHAVDSAIVYGSAAAGVPPLIAGEWPIAGVLTVAGVEQLLPLGAPVCFAGARSATRCGRLEALDDMGQLRFGGVRPQRGDSGSAVFVVDSVTGDATLVGILAARSTTGTAPGGYATYLSPALDRLRARARVDRVAHAGVAALPGYSDLVIAG